KLKTEATQRFELNQIREKSKLNNTQEAVTEVDVLRETLKSIPLFKGGTISFFHELALALKLRIFQPNENIIVQDEPGSSMFFVADGIADVVSKDGKTVYGEFRPSSFFGEVALFYVINRTATIRARAVCTTLELHKDSLRAILAQHESLARTMLAKAEENYKLAIERQKAVKKLQSDGDTHKFTLEDTIERLSKANTSNYVPTFKKASPNFIRTMAQYTSVHRFKKGEMICKKGE
ncbi:cyclic nucleotide-binding-like protein, partial [Chytriomyces sp. MP71]